MSGYGSCCSIRAIWILNPQDSIVFSRLRFLLSSLRRPLVLVRPPGRDGPCAAECRSVLCLLNFVAVSLTRFQEVPRCGETLARGVPEAG